MLNRGLDSRKSPGRYVKKEISKFKEAVDQPTFTTGITSFLRFDMFLHRTDFARVIIGPDGDTPEEFLMSSSES